MVMRYSWDKKDLRKAGWVIGKPFLSNTTPNVVIGKEEPYEWTLSKNALVLVPVRKETDTCYLTPYVCCYGGDILSYIFDGNNPPALLLEVPHEAFPNQVKIRVF